MIGDLPEQAQLIEAAADQDTAHRSQREGGRQCDAYIVQAFIGEHGGELSVAHAHGLEDAKFLLAGQKVCDQSVGKVDQ